MERMPEYSKLVWRPRESGYQAQTVGMVRILKGMKTLDRVDYLNLLRRRILEMCKEEGLEESVAILEAAGLDIGWIDRLDPEEKQLRKLASQVVERSRYRLSQLEILEDFEEGPQPIPEKPDFQALERLQEISLGEWAGALTYTGRDD